MPKSTSLKTFLWFGGQLDDALAFYQETFDDIVIHSLNRPNPDGPLFTAEFSIYGHDFIGLNATGGPLFNDSISLALNVDGQEEVDRLWDALTTDGKAGKCGWCVDKFGLSWQVTPIQMREHLGNPDPEAAAYAMQALRQMGKIVLEDFVRKS